MTGFDIQQALGARFNTSQDADKYTDKLRQNLGLDTKAQVVRLAIGRSLALGNLKGSGSEIDSKGLAIPASSLFTHENIAAWIGLVYTHSKPTEEPLTLEVLRSLIRRHWHRGVLALWADWEASNDSYDKFVETLVFRRSQMPEHAPGTYKGGEGGEGPEKPLAPELKDESQQLVKALADLDIKVQIKGVIFGSRVTRYRVLLINLQDRQKLERSVQSLGLAMNLRATPAVSNGDEARVLFVDLPRTKESWETVRFDKLTTWAATSNVKDINKLQVYAGVTVTGQDVSFDLAKTPHLLVAGTTNSGKSVCLHSLILSLLMNHSSDSLQLALIDPKQVEFAAYGKIPHLYSGLIATEANQSRDMLESLVALMEERYTKFKELNVVNIAEAREKGQTIPYVVVFVEEMADLVLRDPDSETLLERLAQKARAAGIHLVLATQHPDANTFSGLIRSNIPGRIALQVQKGTESKIILDETGAENLLGSGDMLVRLPGDQQPTRAHGIFVQAEDIANTIRGIK